MPKPSVVAFGKRTSVPPRHRVDADATSAGLLDGRELPAAARAHDDQCAGLAAAAVIDASAIDVPAAQLDFAGMFSLLRSSGSRGTVNSTTEVRPSASAMPSL
jgi:hypothetical protein